MNDARCGSGQRQFLKGRCAYFACAHVLLIDLITAAALNVSVTG
jgi:hypothetical protein